MDINHIERLGIYKSMHRTFMGEMWTIDGETKQIASTYQPIINCHHVRQAASIKVVQELPDSKIRFMEIPLVSKKPEEKKLLPGKKLIRCKSFPKLSKKHKEGEFDKIEVNNKRTKVVFQFIYHPEYLELGSTFVIADSTIHACGEITKIFYDV